MYEVKYHECDLSKVSVLVTGGAGFIGSNLVEYLIKNKIKKVRILDNFSTGFHHNIDEFKNFYNFELLEGDIRDLVTCKKAVEGMDYVLHQAALGSVPRSIDDPITTNEVNIDGHLNMLVAIKESKTVKRMVYAASSSTYGDSASLPKVEDVIGKPLSPYAITKYVNELYAEIFGKTYGTDTIGLRYFNIFGPRQDPNGAYAAVIPLFMKALVDKESPTMNGDGEQTRDFTFIENAVQANIKALFASKNAGNQIYNIAVGKRVSLLSLWAYLKKISNSNVEMKFGSHRLGDVRDSLANVSKAENGIQYVPKFQYQKGLEITYKWFKKNYDLNQ